MTNYITGYPDNSILTAYHYKKGLHKATPSIINTSLHYLSAACIMLPPK